MNGEAAAEPVDRNPSLLEEAEGYVRSNPLPALLGALAAGLVIGFIARSLEREREPEPIRDAVNEIRGALKPFAKKTRKAYATSSEAVREAIDDAVARVKGIEVDECADPVAKWWKRLWK